ncbi:unnamed protein product [Caenorhabditis angaria]|uniref:Uncharacterized protein n=1 Tax=Caenorhabditis angaria TaxID=860376 RepID=A0A9P1I510_9PELO|nr:unnamed protein product [Caenorhabditis angaria]
MERTIRPIFEKMMKEEQVTPSEQIIFKSFIAQRFGKREDDSGNISNCLKSLEQLKIANSREEMNRDNTLEQAIDTNNRNDESSSIAAENQSDQNDETVDLSTFLTPQNTFLKIIKKPLPFFEEIAAENISYPLSVIYDEKLNQWFFCDKDRPGIYRVKIVGENRGIYHISNRLLSNPSAVCIYEEGRSIAILSGKTNFTIYIYNIQSDNIEILCSFNLRIYEMNWHLRGLAKSVGGNILSLESRNYTGKNLRIFKNNVGSACFSLNDYGAIQPSFITSRGNRVAISDLGVNSVYLLEVNDLDFTNITFQVLRVLKSESMELNKICDHSSFAFVSGLIFDIDYNLLIGDAQGKCIKLFDENLEFLHRVSTDFPMPYLSSFFINQAGQIMILNIRSPTDRLIFGQLTSCAEVERWNHVEFPTRRNNNRIRQ